MAYTRRDALALAGAGLAGALAAPWHSGRASELGGRPFSDPRQITPMPEDWRRRPLARPASLDCDLALAIDQQLYPAIQPLVARFAQARHLRIAMQEGTCGIAAGALAERTADITGMCCPPGDLDRLPGVRYHTVGIAAVALIVHPDNPLDDVDLDTARRLFDGTARRWSDLPVSGLSAGGTVQAITRLHCQSRPGHWHLLLDRAEAFSPRAFDVPDIADMIMAVSRDRHAVGYETLWHVADKAQLGAIKALRLNGVHPADRAAVAAGRYPLYRTFDITSWTEPPAADPRARDLARHLVEHARDIDPVFGIVAAADLRAGGWRFEGDEIVAPPA